jgi:hypothetical protein
VTHTFDIRFAPSAGVAAWRLEPVNRFRWKGTGKLSIAADSITIAARRGFISRFRRLQSRRIEAVDLKEVYREGAALRLEFSTADCAREVLPLWVDDRETAASIVQLLPTTRTVELDDAPSRTAAIGRFDRRVIASLLVGIGIGALTTWLGLREAARTSSADVSQAPVATRAETVADAEAASSDVETRARTLRATPAFQRALPSITDFHREADVLLAQYRLRRHDLETDRIDRLQFARMLRQLETEWSNTSTAILADESLANPRIADVRAELEHVARRWREFLTLYADGMLHEEPATIRRAFDTLGAVEWTLMQMRWRYGF